MRHIEGRRHRGDGEESEQVFAFHFYFRLVSRYFFEIVFDKLALPIFSMVPHSSVAVNK